MGSTSWIDKMSHDTTGSMIWFILLAVAARGLYIMIERKDYSIAFCFTAVLCFSIYMVLVSLGFLPAPE